MSVVVIQGLDKTKTNLKGDSGIDLIVSDVEYIDKDIYKLHTEIKVKMPEHIDAEIRPRSSTLLKHGLIVVHGTIDSNYRGFIGISVYDTKSMPYPNDLIGKSVAQLIFRNKPSLKIISGKVENDTERGNKGFGSTGV